jgi:hypothetical protein
MGFFFFFFLALLVFELKTLHLLGLYHLSQAPRSLCFIIFQIGPPVFSWVSLNLNPPTYTSCS